MAEMSDYLENTLIDFLFRTAAFAKPTAIHVALSTATITDATTGSTITEPADTYARVARAPLDANWDATSGTDGLTANTAVITWATATGSWGTITDSALIDAATVGNMWFYTAVDTPKAITTDDTAEYAAGALTVTLA